MTVLHQAPIIATHYCLHLLELSITVSHLFVSPFISVTSQHTCCTWREAIRSALLESGLYIVTCHHSRLWCLTPA